MLLWLIGWEDQLFPGQENQSNYLLLLGGLLQAKDHSLIFFYICKIVQKKMIKTLEKGLKSMSEINNADEKTTMAQAMPPLKVLCVHQDHPKIMDQYLTSKITA